MLFACVYSIIEVLFNKNIIQDVLLSLFDVHGYIAQGAEDMVLNEVILYFLIISLLLYIVVCVFIFTFFVVGIIIIH